jgi:amino acid transporter
MSAQATTNSGEVTLSREMNLFTVTMIGVGGMIGAGIFVLTGIAAGEAGAAVILVFLLNGVVTSLTAMSYAELGSVLPGAGGGYIFIKEAMGGTAGFLAGWMSWFAQAVAGSLYGLAFGRFAAELINLTGFPTFGLTIDQLSLAFMTIIIITFIFINSLGASETAAAGNILTLTKIAILGVLVAFGLAAISGTDLSQTELSTDFFSHGVIGVLSAMGLTFIAFEGYEIIAQSGDEVINPKRNIPIAIFASIAIAVVIYVLVAFVAIGATTAPAGITVSAYLGEQGEVAIIEVASQVFPWGIGALVLLVSGLASTTSALNATTYRDGLDSSDRGHRGRCKHHVPAALHAGQFGSAVLATKPPGTGSRLQSSAVPVSPAHSNRDQRAVSAQFVRLQFGGMVFRDRLDRHWSPGLFCVFLRHRRDGKAQGDPARGGFGQQ